MYVNLSVPAKMIMNQKWIHGLAIPYRYGRNHKIRQKQPGTDHW